MKGRRPRRSLPGGGMGSANSAAWRCRYRHFERAVIGRCAPSPQLPHINLLSPAKELENLLPQSPPSGARDPLTHPISQGKLSWAADF